MHRYPFIFSDKFKYRFSRHFLWWFAWWLFQGLLYSFTPLLLRSQPAWNRFLISYIEAFFFLMPHMFMAYALMYFVIPKFIVKGKYVTSALVVAGICIVAAFLSAAINNYLLIYIRRAVLIDNGQMARLYTNETSIWLSLLAGLRGGITIGGFAAAIKLMKYWYIKEQRNLQLQKENTESQLQLLKAQVHPHFLFNTLNNIYSHTQATAPVASQLVMGLSDMLRYMLYECRQDKVPLDKELKMLQDYTTLEKIRYGNQLELNVDIPDHTENLTIAPLLLLPFVENAFKHGSSHIIDQPWISLSVTIDEKIMRLKVVNGKASTHARPVPGHGGIGISNVRKRLDLIYPNRHVLDITDEEDVFIVNLKIELDKAVLIKDKLILQSRSVYA
jgi:uncharacterized membrane-anchored protein YhcB (DUF1043 family)